MRPLSLCNVCQNFARGRCRAGAYLRCACMQTCAGGAHLRLWSCVRSRTRWHSQLACLIHLTRGRSVIRRVRIRSEGDIEREHGYGVVIARATRLLVTFTDVPRQDVPLAHDACAHCSHGRCVTRCPLDCFPPVRRGRQEGSRQGQDCLRRRSRRRRSVRGRYVLSACL